MEGNDNTVDLTLLADSSEEEDVGGGGRSTLHLLQLGQPSPKSSPRFHSKFRGFNPTTGKAIIQKWTRNDMSKEMKEFKTMAKLQIARQLPWATFPIYQEGCLYPDCPTTGTGTKSSTSNDIPIM